MRSAFCSILLRMGFTMRRASPRDRWALTPPFHPCRANTVVCFLWHFPGSHLRSPLAIILPQGARTFLSMADSSHAATICPTSDGGRLTVNAEKANIFWFFASEANVEQGLARVVKKRVGRLCVWACERGECRVRIGAGGEEKSRGGRFFARVRGFWAFIA